MAQSLSSNSVPSPSFLTNKLKAMRVGGKLLGQIKHQLASFTQVGTTFEQIEAEAQRLIKAGGAKPSFSTVPGYDWATCIMKNDALCHGIPGQQTVADGDIVTIDVGLLYEGFHLDTTITLVVGQSSPQKEEFLAVGRKSLAKAISKVKAGATVFDVSRAMQKIVEAAGYSCVYQLTGHGVGGQLHEEPSIPCVASRSDKKIKFYEGQTVAVEIMYAMGEPHLVLDKDGWTYRTADGSLSGMFEETVAVTKKGAEILTA